MTLATNGKGHYTDHTAQYILQTSVVCKLCWLLHSHNHCFFRLWCKTLVRGAVIKEYFVCARIAAYVLCIQQADSGSL